MDELKGKVKDLVPDGRKSEVDVIFHEWIAGLRVHEIADSVDEPEVRNGSGTFENPRLEELKRRFEKLQGKMKIYNSVVDSDERDAVKSDVIKEIDEFREEISNVKCRFRTDGKSENEISRSSNAQLVEKLREMKSFLEKLK